MRRAALPVGAQAAILLTLGTLACQAFVGGLRQAARRESAVARRVELTGKSRKCPKTPQFVYPKLAEEDKRDLTWGWDSEQGRWFDLAASGIKWWQRPGYLTPNGYRQPPHWNLRDYALCLEEYKFAHHEALLVRELKERGMTYEEIKAKASVYEFIEDPKRPKMTDKMLFLFQVSALHKGKTEELIDLRDTEINEERIKEIRLDSEKQFGWKATPREEEVPFGNIYWGGKRVVDGKPAE